jgi:FAD/FMN-containing dehydrogenase
VRGQVNLRFVKLPLAIAFPRTVEDVAFWVNFVRDHELSVSIRSGNNSYEGLSSSNEVIVDLSFLTLGPGKSDKQFEVDTEAKLVHVASGVRLGVLYTELDKLRLALAGGQCAPVCVGGLVGTGGVGFSTRAFGFACDQLVEVQYVLADGRVVVANASNEHADLYRASKGAGAAGLGVMTRLTLRVVPAPCVLFYTTVFDLEDGAAVLAAWQNLTAMAPDALSSVAAANASADGAAVLVVNGEFRVEDGRVDEAKDTLTKILQDHWLKRLPPQPDEHRYPGNVDA